MGIIKNSNLCTEIIQYSSNTETSVCTLGSIAVNKCVFYNSKKKAYDFSLLHDSVNILVDNLNCIIDTTTYPSTKSKLSSLKHRPIGIGIQGLADLFMILKLPYDSKEAKRLNILIYKNIYFSALKKSCDLA